ncbi:MAG: hypothetical protein M0Q91_12700 [Methanoregula sp.]|jgi:hypothetical protein|nr:hypothetical protein [Methanoregula sp.]
MTTHKDLFELWKAQTGGRTTTTPKNIVQNPVVLYGYQPARETGRVGIMDTGERL